MPTEMLDQSQVENNTRLIEELKISVQALNSAITDFLSKDIEGEEERGKLAAEFNLLLLHHINMHRGVDIETNMNLGKVVLTKYDRSEKARRWEIHENTEREQQDTDTSGQ